MCPCVCICRNEAFLQLRMAVRVLRVAVRVLGVALYFNSTVTFFLFLRGLGGTPFEVSKGVSQTKAAGAPTASEPRASRRAFGRAGFDKIWRDFSVVQHASASRHGGSPAAGLAASRHPRRDRQQLHRCSGGLRLPAAPCSADVPLQAQMLAAWRRPPRGALVGPRCQGRIRSGRPFKAPNGHGGRSRARRPSGEPRLRGVARVDLCYRERKCELSCEVDRLHLDCDLCACLCAMLCALDRDPL